MNVFVMSFLAGHIKVYDLVLISIIDIEGGFDVELTALFILNNTAEG